MTSAAAPTPSSTADPLHVPNLTKNQKKKQRQKRSKLYKRHGFAQAGQQAYSGDEECQSVETWHSRDSTAQGSGQSHVGGSASAVSSAHTFQAAALDSAPKGSLPKRSRLHHGSQSATVSHHTIDSDAVGSAAHDQQQTSVTIERQAGANVGAADQHADASNLVCVAHAARPRLQHHGATASASVVAGSFAAAGSVNGSRMDMTAALLLMEAALAAPQPVLPPPGTSDATVPDSSQRRAAVAVHGNYKRYYGYRLAGPDGEDARFKVFERNWFAGKRCLDYGCNEGVVTLAVAAKFGTAAMLGMDIDADLVHRACVNLSRERGALTQRLAEARRQGRPRDAHAALSAQRALKGAWFQQGDMASGNVAVEPGSADTLMCLSVTKWVHLNAGDAGLKALFAAFHAALRPGGLLILEPQPWRSYKAALRKQEVAGSLQAGALAQLKLRPEDFAAYLEREAGFRLVRPLTAPSSDRGFDRPMYLLEKLTYDD